MKAKGFAAIGFIVVVLALAVGTVILANAPMGPTPQKVEQSIPDDHIPR